jgi:hypothetical protein
MAAPGVAARTLRVAWMAACVVLLLALAIARRTQPQGPTLQRDPYAAFDTDGEWRRRAVELTALHRQALGPDRFVEAEAQRPAWPGLVVTSAALAFTWTATPSPEWNGADDAGRVEAIVRRWMLVCALASAACGAWIAARLASGAGVARLRAALVTGGFLALSPWALEREHVERFDPHALLVLLCCAQLGACAFALYARERIDVLAGALVAGAAAGAGLVAGVETWPVAAACGGALGLHALREVESRSREALLSPVCFVLVLLAVAGVGAGPLDARELAPAFDGRARGWLAASPSWIAGVAIAAAAALRLAFERRVDPFQAALLTAGSASFLLALVDARFSAPAHAALALAAGSAAAREYAHLPSHASRVAWITLWIALALVLFDLRPAAGSQTREVDDLRAGLTWLRENSVAPGPFNHPAAEQDWRVASAPRLAGPIVRRARRPTVAAEREHAASEAAHALELAFGAESDAEFTRRLDSNGARWIVASSAMQRDEKLCASAASSARVARLLDPQASLAGWRAARAFGDPISCVVWEREEAEAPGPAQAR